MRALLLENLHPLASTILTDAGFEVETRQGALSEDELIAVLERFDLLGIRSKTEVTRRVLTAHPDLVAVGAFCIGTNQIDLDAATELGIAAFNAPYSNTRSVVELAIANIIAMARRLTERDKALHAGIWDKSSDGSHEVRGRTLGIVGYGNIGSQLSVVAEMLGMQVYFYDTEEKLALGNARRCSSLDELQGTVQNVPELVVAPATASTHRCAACPTSSSRRTSADPPRRRRRTSAGSSAPSSVTTCAPAAPPCRSTCRH